MTSRSRYHSSRHESDGKERRRSHRHSKESDRHKKRHDSHHKSKSRHQDDEFDNNLTLESLNYKNTKYKFFDIPANGFENVQPDQYLQMIESGQIPRLIYVPADSLNINSEVPWGGCFVNTQAKRLYVGNIPLSTDESDIIEFFDNMMQANSLKSAEPGSCVISSQLNHDKNFAFIEMRSVDETTNAMVLDGVQFHGSPLKIRRPRDYQPIQTWSISGEYESLPSNLKIRSFANTESNSNRLIISNLPESYSQADVRNLLAAYGPIKHCEFMTETDANGKIRGYAIGDYDDPIITADAIKSLNGMMIDDHTLTVKPANQVGATLANALPGAASVHVPGINLMSSTENPSNILCMMNMVASEDLNNDSDYEDIYEDIKEECEKFGEVVSLEIPRPREGIEDVPGLGKVFVEFRTLDESKKALENLSGRKFDENIVVISFFNPEKYHHRQFQ